MYQISFTIVNHRVSLSRTRPIWLMSHQLDE